MAARARAIASSGIGWPKEMVAGLDDAAAGAQAAARPSPAISALTQSSSWRCLAGEAFGIGAVAVKLDDALRRHARQAVQIVDVLGDDVACTLPHAHEPGDRLMAAAGLDVAETCRG